MAKSRTVEDVVAELARAIGHEKVPARWLEAFCRWPPNAFALASLVLGESGAYRRCVSPPADQHWPPIHRKDWLERQKDVAKRWRAYAANLDESQIPAPPELEKYVRVLSSRRSTRLADLASADHAWELTSALLELFALADETCAGMGLPDTQAADVDQQALILDANDLLMQSGTLCFWIPPGYLRVLPKRHTPQSGLSLRSLSLNVAMVRGEVDTQWQMAWGRPKLKRDGRVNLLVVPWPQVITPAAFTEVMDRAKAEKALDMDKHRFGFFDFGPPKENEPQRLAKLLQSARTRVGFIDAVVLPECALHLDQVPELQKVLDENEVPLYLTGVRAARRNSALLGVRERDGWTPSNQDKHHRWYLDRSQIEMYGLGGALHPAKRWWENIDLPPRTLHFVTPADWLTLCHLVCEDLARQDPVAHAVRSVGPTLVIALLLDGPQRRDRWAARYATVLADDPGSSVLTVTSLGMALRSAPPGHSPSRVVALWKDAGSAAREIELAPGAEGVVLSICSTPGMEEYSADGRSTERMSATLAGVEQIAVS